MTAISDPPSLDMLRPPTNRAMRVLDRALFRSSIPTSAARVFNPKQISRYRDDLHVDILKLDRKQAVISLQDSQGANAKALLLKPGIRSDDESTWSPKISDLVKSSEITLVPYDLTLDYDYWTYHDIISSILPEDVEDDIPSGFTVVGHIAHLNLRERYLPYKKLIAEVLMDKNPHIRTVINKTDAVGGQNEYRTFSYELLAGEHDMRVEVHEANCVFSFDYSKVYWNSRLETEHKRLVEKFQPGEAICDVMAGVGPFAVPSGKKRCFVWANDLNPDSYASLEDAVTRNKVASFVKSFNEDGRTFIRAATKSLMYSDTYVDITPKQSRTNKLPHGRSPPPVYMTFPKFFSHYVLNLPASAMTFLSAFIGVYAGCSDRFEPYESRKLPMVHVHCFSAKSDDDKEVERRISQEVSEQLRHDMKPGDPENEGEVEIWDVRDVAPSKRMFCASFRLPKQVAFSESPG